MYRRSDPNKTNYIAKHLRAESSELAIHEYLHSRPYQSPHIISIIDVVPSTTREWLILPNLFSIRKQWLLDEQGVTGRVRLCRGLIEGLAHLHNYKIAHRDIKPGNLVRDQDFNLKIIDFDIAIRVDDENTETEGYCGTEGWTAPEIGKEDTSTMAYSPIKADRWSCGRVILRHLIVGVTVGKGVRHLSEFANRLMANDPQQRPSLLEWPKFLATPLITTVPGRSRRRIETSVKLPDAKKRRFEPKPESVQSQPEPPASLLEALHVYT